MSSQLFYTIDNSNVEGDIEKKIIWADDFIEIFSYQPSTQRTHTFRISCALLSCMIQHFHYDVNLLWKLLADSVKYYDDRIIFSTQHIIYFPIFKDSLGREALRIYESRRLFDNGDSWKLEFYTNTTFPFDLEIHVQLSPKWERRHTYRIEGHLLRPYFEKHCLSVYVKRRGNHLATVAVAISNDAGDHQPQGSITVSPLGDPVPSNSVGKEDLDQGGTETSSDNDGVINYEKETNHMLNAIAEELIYDKELDQLMIKSIDLMRLADYLENSVRNHQLPDPMLRSESEEDLSDLDDEMTAMSRKSPMPVDENETSAKEGIVQGASQASDQNSEFFSLASQPPPLDKYEKYTAHALLQSQNAHDSSTTTLTASVVSTVAGDVSTIASATGQREQKLNTNRVPLRQPLQIQGRQSNASSGGEDYAGTPPVLSKSGSIANKDHKLHNQSQQQQTSTNLQIIQHPSSRRSQIGAVLSGITNDTNTDGSSSSSSFSMRHLQEKFKDLNFFSRTFDYSHYRQLKEAGMKDTIDSIVVQSKEDYKLAKQEELLLSKNPLNDFVKEFTTNSSYTNHESKAFMIRQAAAIRAEHRSAMSTRVIMDFLQNNCKMANYLSYCSIYDLEALANAVQLVDITPPFDKTKLHYSLGVEFGDTIANIYILLSGNVVIDRLDTLLLDLNDEIFQDMDINSQWKYIFNHPQLYENQNVFSREDVAVGDILGENVLNGEYGWTFHIHSLSVSPSSSSGNGLGSIGIDAGVTPEAVTFLRIPVPVIQRCIGRKGNDVEESMIYFWKMTRLWNEIVSYNKSFMHTTLFHSLQQQGPSNGDTRQKAGPVHGNTSFQPMNSIESARLRTYQAGAEIFVQGQPRVYLYVIRQGSATYYRDFPKDRVGLDVMPERVETVQQCAHALPKLVPINPGNETSLSFSMDYHNHINSNSEEGQAKQNSLSPAQHSYVPQRIEDGEETDGGMLLSNDFSFMDSEDASIINRIETQDAKFLEEIGMNNSNKKDDEAMEKQLAMQTMLGNNNKERQEQIFEYRKRRYHRFLNHQNTLIATTRCEVIVVPISEIAKCLPLFRQLIQLANLRYPMIMVDNEEVIRQFYHRKQWEDYDKSHVLHEVSRNKIAKRLLQDDLHFPGGYESDTRYKRSPKQMLLSPAVTGISPNSSVAMIGPTKVVNLSFCTSFNSPSRCRTPGPNAGRVPAGGQSSPIHTDRSDGMSSKRRPNSAVQSPRPRNNQYDDADTIAPFSPKTPKSSASSSRPMSSRPKTAISVAPNLSAGGPIDGLTASDAHQQNTTQIDVIKLEYLEKYRNILASTSKKYEAENAEMLKILNSHKAADENHKKESKFKGSHDPKPPIGIEKGFSKQSSRQHAVINRLVRPTSASIARSVQTSAGEQPKSSHGSSTKGSENNPANLHLEILDNPASQHPDNTQPKSEVPNRSFSISPVPPSNNNNNQGAAAGGGRRRAIQANVQNVHDLELVSAGYKDTKSNGNNAQETNVEDDDYCHYNFQLQDRNAELSLKKREKLENAEKEQKEMQKVLFTHLLFHHQNKEENIIATTTLGSPKKASQSPKKMLLTPDQYAQLYRERVTENPKQRFLDEFVRKSHL